MTTPPELLEQALAAHGDTLYRSALFLGGDERRAEALLRATTAELLARGLAAPPDEAELLAALALAARREEERRPAPRRPARPPADLPPLYRSALNLPLDQRIALGYYLLAGYDTARLARAPGIDEAAAREALVGAVRALAPATGHSLTDRVGGETCPDVRAALLDPAGRARHSNTVRGHLAACAACRSFEHVWGEVTQAAESALRATLRDRRLPAPLAARLLDMARPRRRALSPSLRFVVPPLAVLALVAALVLPGFGRRAVTVVDRADAPQADPQALVAQALASHGRPPEAGPQVWHGRYETLWYFNEETIAPLQADLWLDRENPARHRIQIAHASGGAPYELQLGDGRDLLHYALDGSYAPALYGVVDVHNRPDTPLLLTMPMDREGQARALAERLDSGPWGIPPFYLRQAERAQDLRLLGRLSEGGEIVQVLSFSGFSPLGLPPDAPGATAERVTVMLALDADDGRLRSATELSGPPGGTQVSRVTWRLVEETLHGAVQNDPAFSIDRAWNGLGDFPDRIRHQPADLAVPAIPAAGAADPTVVLSSWPGSFGIPSSPPPGADRALLYWPQVERERGQPPIGLIYSGPGRTLVIGYTDPQGVRGEPEQIGDWTVRLAPGRGQVYRADIRRDPDQALIELGGNDPGRQATIFARGYSRDELAAVIASMRPLDLESLADQAGLFVHPRSSGAIRAALLDSLRFEVPAAEGVRYSRLAEYGRLSPDIVDLPDPYHNPGAAGFPLTTTVELWQAGGAEGRRSYERRSAEGAELSSSFQGSDQIWSYNNESRALFRYGAGPQPTYAQLSRLGQLALDMLGNDVGELSLAEGPDGGRLLRLDEPAAASRSNAHLLHAANIWPYAADLAPVTFTQELALDADGAIAAFRLLAVDGAGAATLLHSMTVEERAELPAAEAPAALSGEPPPADYVRDWDRQPGAATAQLRIRTLEETLELIDFPLYLLPEEGGRRLQQVDTPPPESVTYYNTRSGNLGNEIVGEGLAVRLVYTAALESDSPALAESLTLIQGPAAPLRAYLRSFNHQLWDVSFAEPVVFAGGEGEAWVGLSDQSRSFILLETEATLLILEAPARWSEEQARQNARALAEQLRPAGP